MLNSAERLAKPVASPETPTVGTKLCPLPDDLLDFSGFRLEPQPKVRRACRREFAAALVNEPRRSPGRRDVDEELRTTPEDPELEHVIGRNCPPRARPPAGRSADPASEAHEAPATHAQRPSRAVRDGRASRSQECRL